MTTETHVTLPFAGGKFRFHLSEEEMFKLEMGISDHPLDRPPRIRIGEAYARLIAGRFLVDGEDVGIAGRAEYSVTEMNAIIRAALKGGGGGTTDDGKDINWKEYCVDSWMQRYVHTMPLAERWNLALAAMGARIEGRKPDDAAA